MLNIETLNNTNLKTQNLFEVFLCSKKNNLLIVYT